MAATIEIRDNGYVVQVVMADPYKGSDLVPLYEADRRHRDAFQQQHPGEKVDLIVDLSRATNPAQGFLQTRQTPSISHPTANYVLIVGANSFMRAMCETIIRITRYNRVKFFDTQDQALAFSREMRTQTEKRRSRTA
jgi:hypothetical protein